ncbi:MAG: hypothetical protein IAF38_13420 [Bacteroidia bacterium]|nr:hypothetical protein [Bacteroidia bacterium]
MRRKILFLFTSVVLCTFLPAQNQKPFVISDSSFKKELLPLDELWLIKNGDDKTWAQKDFQDAYWDTCYSSLDFDEKGETIFKGRAWLRFHFVLDTSLSNVPLSFMIDNPGAAEIYVDGRLIHSLGNVDAEKKFSLRAIPLSLPLMYSGKHVLAVRYSNKNFRELYEDYFDFSPGFTIYFAKESQALESLNYKSHLSYSITLSLGIFFITLSFLHFLLYLFYRKQKTNLYYSAFVFLLSGIFIIPSIASHVNNPETSLKMGYDLFYCLPFFFCSLVAMLYYLLFTKLGKVVWWMLAAIPFVLLSKYFFSFRVSGLISFGYIFSCVVASLSIVISGLKQKKEGAGIIGAGSLFFLLFLLVIIIRNMLGYGTFIALDLKSTGEYFILILMILAVMSIPLSMSVYLARDFAKTNRRLESKLQEVEELSEKNLQQEKEKQKYLESQKELLEQQVAERTSEIMHQKIELETKNKEVTDSIRYASRIQRALLPMEKYIEKVLKKRK